MSLSINNFSTCSHNIDLEGKKTSTSCDAKGGLGASAIWLGWKYLWEANGAPPFRRSKLNPSSEEAWKLNSTLSSADASTEARISKERFFFPPANPPLTLRLSWPKSQGSNGGPDQNRIRAAADHQADRKVSTFSGVLRKQRSTAFSSLVVLFCRPLDLWFLKLPLAVISQDCSSTSLWFKTLKSRIKALLWQFLCKQITNFTRKNMLNMSNTSFPERDPPTPDVHSIDCRGQGCPNLLLEGHIWWGENVWGSAIGPGS